MKKYICRSIIISLFLIILTSTVGYSTEIICLDFSNLNLSWSGLTSQEQAQVQQNIISSIRQDYSNFDIQIVVVQPAAPPYTTIDIGADPGIKTWLGEAAQPSNYGEIYTDNFNRFSNGEYDTVEELSVSIANVASHEIGHTLDLNHVQNDQYIMDEYTPPII